MYPGNVADVEEFSTALTRITRMLDQNQIARETVTLVLDKGSAALANTVALEEAGVGWISALPWNQAPAELRSRGLRKSSKRKVVNLPLATQRTLLNAKAPFSNLWTVHKSISALVIKSYKIHSRDNRLRGLIIRYS